MTPRVGRPRNDWTRSRKRTLIRLYTLTTLNNIEIQKVLEDDGFCPKERNIQTQLQLLFPKDYRRFRPKNDAQMKARLAPIRKVNHGRVTKSQRHKISQSRVTTSRGLDALQGNFDDSLRAFRDYSDHFTRQLAPRLSPASSSDSFPTVSSRLMLDGSFVEDFPSKVGQITESHSGISNPEFSWSRLKDNDRPSHGIESTTEQQASTETSRNSGQFTWETTLQSDLRGTLRPISEYQSESALDAELQRIGEQLPRRSSSFIHRVYSVLSLRSTGTYRTTSSLKTNPTWRSSWMSVSSIASNLSDASSVQLAGRYLEHDTDGVQGLSSTTDNSAKTERKLWNEIIDDTDLLPSPRPTYNDISPTKRPCCDPFLSPYDEMCPKCGWHISLDDARPFQPLHTYKSDYFGNTALHFAARSPSPNLEFILQLIDGGANCNALNTSGQTFMHVLNERTTNYLKHVHCSIYLALLKKLQSHNFPFSHQDCHGRMLAHNLSPAVLASFMRSSSLPEILSILDINLNCVDNYGIDAGHGLGKSPEALPSDTIAPYWLEETEAIVATHRRLPKANISFRRTLLNPNLPKAKTKLRPTFLRRNKVVVDVVDVVDVWLNWVERENLTSWIDVHGDTPLTALLKMWPSEMQDESPLEHAVLQLILKNPNLVNMKDRKGYTPLAIAAIRGSERSMRYLLESGANFNSRNYRGKGIIAQASERMELAKKKGVNKCYTRILTCINLLVDKGAELNPTEFDEFLLPELRGKLDMASYLLHQ